MSKMHLRLIIDVEYDDAMGEKEARRNLNYIAQHAASNGMFSGDSPGTVTGWTHCVEEVDDKEASNPCSGGCSCHTTITDTSSWEPTWYCWLCNEGGVDSDDRFDNDGNDICATCQQKIDGEA